MILNAWSYGIYATAVAGAVYRDLQVTGNTVRNIGTGPTNGWALFLNGSPTVAVTPPTVIANVISDNVIENAMGPNSYGILISQYPNVRVFGNTITGVGHSGIYCLAAHDCDVSRNRIVNAALFGILISGPSFRPVVKDNIIWQWARLSGTAGISVNTAMNGVIQGNSFYFDNSATVEPAAVRVEAGSTQVVVANNTLLFSPKMNYPFVNLSTGANRGTFTVAEGVPAITVNNALATSNCRIVVTQVTGLPTTFRVSPGLGYFTVTLGAPSLSGAMTFSYELLP